MVRTPLTPEEHERGERLGRLLREARGGRTMTDVAASAGISAETLRKIETGRAPFDSDDPLTVEIMGVPHPGEWVVVRTPHGILWPSGRAKTCYTFQIAEALGRRPTPEDRWSQT